jgi:hypothetical protein
MGTKRQRIEEARGIWGDEAVETVVLLVEMADPDGAWSEFMDRNQEEMADCVEFIYFGEDD